jgi:hypothetical protein
MPVHTSVTSQFNLFNSAPWGSLLLQELITAQKSGTPPPFIESESSLPSS